MADIQDTIIIKAPAGTKARWVRLSQREGMKLSEWLVEKVEANMPNVYKITDAVANQYHGAGYALAAVVGGQIVALRYLDDIADETVNEEIHLHPASAKLILARWLDTPPAGLVVRELQVLGQLSVGMCSSWEFVEL